MLAVVFFSFPAISQLSDKMEKEGVVSGTIFKNGGKIEGYIKKTGTAWTEGTAYPAPWEFQSGIKFIPKDVFENNEKIKNKYFETYEPKDCEGYLYDTLYYESVKYADMSAVGLNMIAQKVFMLRILEDKISLYNYFNTPPSVVSGEETFAACYEECAEVQWVYRIGSEGKLKLVNDMNIEKELADCPLVTEKQANGEYKVIGQEGKSSGGNKLLNNLAFRVEVRLMAIDDYNANCGK